MIIRGLFIGGLMLASGLTAYLVIDGVKNSQEEIKNKSSNINNKEEYSDDDRINNDTVIDMSL